MEVDGSVRQDEPEAVGNYSVVLSPSFWEAPLPCSGFCATFQIRTSRSIKIRGGCDGCTFRREDQVCGGLPRFLPTCG